MLLKRKWRFALFKFIGLLSLVRWYNILVVMLAQYLASVFILNPHEGFFEVLLNPALHLTVFSTAFIIASGFIINSFYDLEKDLVNHPSKVVFSRLVSQKTCLNFYFFFNTVGLISSLYVSKRVLLFNFLFTLGLWFYSHKLKKYAFLGNLSATLLTVAPFLVIVVLYDNINYAIFFYVSYMALIVFIREVVKDVLAERGDVIYGYHTLPIDLGRKITKRILYVLMLLSPLPPILLYIAHPLNNVVYYFGGAQLLIVVSAFWVYKARNKSDYQRINTLYKIILFVGILSIALV